MTDKNEEINDKKKRVRNTYPIYMDKDLINKVRDWQEQVKRHFNGLVTVTVSDVCSELLLQSSESLSLKILEGVESKKLDPVKKIKLLLSKAMEADRLNKDVCLKDLLEENSALLGLKTKKKPGSKSKKQIRKTEESSVNKGLSEGLDE